MQKLLHTCLLYDDTYPPSGSCCTSTPSACLSGGKSNVGWDSMRKSNAAAVSAAIPALIDIAVPIARKK